MSESLEERRREALRGYMREYWGGQGPLTRKALVKEWRELELGEVPRSWLNSDGSVL